MNNDEVMRFRVRYGETDRMGTYYYARALEWFEAARTEWTRAKGLTYAEMERRGVMLPVVVSHVEHKRRADYDDLLSASCAASMPGRARVRFDVTISDAESGAVIAEGYTVHALMDSSGRAIKPPDWFVEFMREAAG